MKCRQAFELDLAHFIVDPRSDAWAAFRAHYPGCADCAAEVAVWDEMQVFLRSGGPGTTTTHPSKELLLRYEEQRSTVSEIEAAMLGKHLATCRTCPDELAALRTFDFSIVRRQPSPPLQPWWAFGRDVVAKLRPVVLHPAFAYALVLILLYPAAMQLRLVRHNLPADQIALESTREARAVVQQRTDGNGDRHEVVVPPPPSAERITEEAPDLRSAPTEVLAERAEGSPSRTVTSAATEQTDRRSRVAANVRPPRAASRRTQPTGPEASRVHAASDAAATEPPLAHDDEETEGADALVHGEPAEADSEEPHVLGLAATEEPHDDARPTRRAAKDAGATWSTILLTPGQTPELQRADLTTGVILRLPPTGHDVEIRVVAPSGREAAREIVRSAAGPVEIRVRVAELVEGTYRLSTRRLDGSTSSDEFSELRFRVR